MGVAIGDYDCDGTLDIVKTNFAGDTSSLYRNSGTGLSRTVRSRRGSGRNTRFLGWGVGFVDFDNDGWLDIFLANGHVYPEVRQLKTEDGYEQRKVVYRNLGNGRFADVSERSGRRRHAEGRPRRGVRRLRQRRRIDVDRQRQRRAAAVSAARRPRATLDQDEAVGVESNRTAIGARVYRHRQAPQMDEVRGGGSYLSQNDLRVHFGLGAATTVDASRSAGRAVAKKSGTTSRLTSSTR